MPVSIARGVTTRIRECPKSLTIQAERPSPDAAAVRGLERAREDILNLEAGTRDTKGRDRPPPYVSPVLRARTGPFLFLDCAPTRRRRLAAIPEIVRGRLAEAGVWDALIAAPRPYESNLFRMPRSRAVVLHLYPPPTPPRQGTELPRSWLDQALAWVLSRSGDEEDLGVEIEGMQFPFELRGARAFVEQSRGIPTLGTTLAAGDPGRLHAARWTSFAGLPNIAIAAGGEAAGDEELIEIFKRLERLARELAASVSYAFISIDPDFASLASGEPITEWRVVAGGAFPNTLRHVCDEYVFDAFPHQILGRGHIDRLGRMPPGARALDADRVELALGNPRDWLPNPWLPDGALEDRNSSAWVSPWLNIAARRRDSGVQDRSRSLLAPCLLTADEAHRAVRAKWDQAKPSRGRPPPQGHS